MDWEQKELSTEESQKAALQVLIAFDKICKENNFRYYLMYGTLIGAIRHNGFIPWDDDIDVMMPREDFDKFIDYGLKHEKELYPLKLHTRANTLNYYYGIPRFSDMRYKYIKSDGFNAEFDMGAFIDIYPWDNYGNSKDEGVELRKHCLRKSMKYLHYVNSKCKDDNKLKAALRSFTYRILRILKGANYSNMIDQEVRSYVLSNTSGKDKYYGHVVWAIGVCQFEKDKLMKLEMIPHEFAGYQFNIPAAYDYILTKSYGDYMKMPPEEQRHSTHDYKLVVREC